MVTKRVIRINSSEAEHLAAKDLVAIAAAAGDNSAAINKASNEQSKSNKSSAANSDDDCLDKGGGEKRRRSLPSLDTANNNEPTIKRRRQHKSFVIDLSDVPPQPPIPKSKRYVVKEGASKYTGVSFNKQSNKWTAQIMIEGKQHTIGRRYDNEEDAAVDYARAVFKYKGGVKDREQRDSFVIDLSGVPRQPPIPKSSGRIREGASKYTGVFLNQQRCKWTAQIRIDGKLLHIGYYDDEEDAAVDYARAVFKYKGGVVHPR